MQEKKSFSGLSLVLGASLSLLAMPSWATDWQAIPGQKITLFYPGQASWEWLLTEHQGAAMIKAGQFCRQCHEGMQDAMGQKLVSGQLLEPTPLADKPGSVEVEVKTAYDANKFYLHLEWNGAAIAGDKASPDFAAMASIMLDDGQVPEIARAGCWGACHADVNSMGSADDKKNIGKYLVKSRNKMTRQGGGDHIKPEAELSALFNSEFFAEIWQARLNPDQTASVSNGYILDSRHDHAPTLVMAQADFNNGNWSAEFSRKLNVNSPGYKNIEPGKTYTIGFAVHNGYVDGRRHYVSFGYTLRLNEGTADFIARRQ